MPNVRNLAAHRARITNENTGLSFGDLVELSHDVTSNTEAANSFVILTALKDNNNNFFIGPAYFANITGPELTHLLLDLLHRNVERQ